MRLKRHAPLLESALKRVAVRPLISSQCTRFRYSSSSAAQPQRIAVLGGGISGLSSAYFISKEFPNSKITVYEGDKVAGGWIRSKRVDVDGGTVLFESGPRTLRVDVATLYLIQELGLAPNITVTNKSSPGAKNRYIYYPDRLNALPSEIPSPLDVLNLWQSGILDGVSGIISERWQPRRPSTMTDESIGSFLERRVDKRIANNLVSAVFHGIYAGDIWELSAKTLLPLLWQLEGRYGYAVFGYFKMQSELDGADGSVEHTLYNPHVLAAARRMRSEIHLENSTLDALKGAAVYSFPDGLGRLVQGLEENLKKNRNVKIKYNSPVHSVKMIEEPSLQVEVAVGKKPSQTTNKYDLVISTLPEKEKIAECVTVMSVNLFFPQERLLPVQGFGYLIPQSVPFEQNPERALGVIFDSDAMPGQDTAKGTKVTVMLGGHWWKGWTGFPDKEEGLAMARNILHRHLNITAEPTMGSINLVRECIPQYTVGYEDRLERFARGISNKYQGRVRVVGSQYGGVGINDCIRGAWDLARDLRGDGWKSNSCGLDRWADPRPWVVAPTLLGYGKL